MTHEQIASRLVDVLKGNLDQALVATDVWEKGSGESITGYNSNPTATRLFDDFYEFMETNLQQSKFPSLARYFMLELEHNNVVVVVHYGELLQGMLVNLEKANMGRVISLTIPRLFRVYDETDLDGSRRVGSGWARA